MLKLTSDIAYNKHLIVDYFIYQGIEYRVYLEKSFFKCKNLDQYFLKIYNKNECVGYVYFYLDFNSKECSYIGLYVKDNYRNSGFASLLMSYWLQLCLDNDFYNCMTNKRQRKPFLLYLLKTYGFEVPNPLIYDESRHLISIYRDSGSLEKFLLFKNKLQEENFRHGSIMREDNYQIIDSLTLSQIHLDDILLSTRYVLQGVDKAYTKSRGVLDRYERNLNK